MRRHRGEVVFEEADTWRRFERYRHYLEEATGKKIKKGKLLGMMIETYLNKNFPKELEEKVTKTSCNPQKKE